MNHYNGTKKHRNQPIYLTITSQSVSWVFVSMFVHFRHELSWKQNFISCTIWEKKGITWNFLWYPSKVYSHISTLIFSFAKKIPGDILVLKGPFQVIDKNSLQTKPQKWTKDNYQYAFQQIDTKFSVHAFSNFDLPIITHGNFLDVFEWIVFAPPENIMVTKVSMNCFETIGIEVLLLYGFSYSGHLANKYTCMKNQSQDHHGIHKTFLVTMSIIVERETIKKSNLVYIKKNIKRRNKSRYQGCWESSA